MDFDNPKVYGDTSITDGLVFLNFFSSIFGNVFPTLSDFSRVHYCYDDLTLTLALETDRKDAQGDILATSSSTVFRTCKISN